MRYFLFMHPKSVLSTFLLYVRESTHSTHPTSYMSLSFIDLSMPLPIDHLSARDFWVQRAFFLHGLVCFYSQFHSNSLSFSGLMVFCLIWGIKVRHHFLKRKTEKKLDFSILARKMSGAMKFSFVKLVIFQVSSDDLVNQVVGW